MINNYSEAVNRRKTDNTMAKRKLTKEHTTISKLLHRKIKIEQYESHNKADMNSGISDWEAISAQYPILQISLIALVTTN
jgi:hypothetical protein